MASEDQISRFWGKVNISPSLEDCWEWKAKWKRNGYGMFRLSSEQPTITASRFAWIITYGDIPDNLLVCHKCDNRACCNPTHLFLGTHRDNIIDMYQKGRGGDRNYRGPRTLTPDQVSQIKSLQGQMSNRSIARVFGVTHETIGKIFRGKTWRSE